MPKITWKLGETHRGCGRKRVGGRSYCKKESAARPLMLSGFECFGSETGFFNRKTGGGPELGRGIQKRKLNRNCSIHARKRGNRGDKRKEKFCHRQGGRLPELILGKL